MSAKYKAVGWNRQKRIYDAVLLGGIVAVAVAYVVGTLIVSPRTTPETLIIRSTALTSAILLHVILCIGPLARLSTSFLPLLYNRRHLGVAMFLLAAVHAIFSVIQFHALGPVNPLVSIFTSYKVDYVGAIERGAYGQFPFEPLGLLALIILFFMAVTSHDFWLKHLGASMWKLLHIAVYVAYGSLIVHVAYGVLQSETSPLLVGAVAVGFMVVFGVHVAAGIKEAAIDRASTKAEADGYVKTCVVDELEDGCGKTLNVEGDRIALFRDGEHVYALSNVCRHQGGPIGEGRILDGCVTCPWHGWQYRPEDGVSPPPFHEVLETYPLRIVDGHVYVHPQPHPEEKKTEGALIASGGAG